MKKSTYQKKQVRGKSMKSEKAKSLQLEKALSLYLEKAWIAMC